MAFGVRRVGQGTTGRRLGHPGWVLALAAQWACSASSGEPGATVGRALQPGSPTDAGIAPGVLMEPDRDDSEIFDDPAEAAVSEAPSESEVAACSGVDCRADVTLVSSCGDGTLDEGEACDDGNTRGGDGCTGQCTLEPNFDCGSAGQPCVSTIVCGDGQVGGREACDDGNVEAGDGCSDVCRVEEGFGCSGSPSECVPDVVIECGDATVSAGENCDDGNAEAGDGCSATCELEDGFTCPVVGLACELIDLCGDGQLDPGEECDDANEIPNDGCDARCILQDDFICPTPGAPCVSTVECGDGRISRGEECDDANRLAGDGCSANCLLEIGFVCPSSDGEPAAGTCTAVPEPTCGDGLLAAVEACDDGNLTSGDGCSAVCAVESGFDCPSGPGELCVQVARCGDGAVNLVGELCDDGNQVGGDGCTADCLRETDFSCPAEGGACISLVVCGDGLIRGAETCDDQNSVAGDGCTDCQLEVGFECPLGDVCQPICGDGLRRGREQCDDGNELDGDGCTALCRLESGFVCSEDASGVGGDVCVPTTCGELGREGTEQCDDNNDVPYDGCFECRNEPLCGYDEGGDYRCVAVCGDGMTFDAEECDDGNAESGDGCSESCQLEPGFACEQVVVDLGDQLDLPIIFRDFPDTHPQFEIDPGGSLLMQGMVQSALGRSGKPEFNPDYEFNGRAFALDGAKPSAFGTATLLDVDAIASRFSEWYEDVPGENQSFVDFLVLPQQPDGSFQFSASLSADPPAQFFPLSEENFPPGTLEFGNQGRENNFHFTSEVRHWFEYEGGELLTFSGDDDVWVFVNGQLTLDLGGVHQELFGSIEMGGDEGELSELCIQPAFQAELECQPVSVPIDAAGVNEVVVFQAERRVTESNYTLTLRGFNAPTTVCESVCGDGIVTPDEACDDGDDNQPPGTYEACDTSCTRGPRCGDGVVQADDGEACDDGLNISTYGLVAGDCAPGCVLPPTCGDGNIDGSNGEQCDDGASNAAPGTYEACDTSCQQGPSCGDGVAQLGEGEECDDGALNGSAGSLCLLDCRLRCGNGVVDQGEECDDGLLENVGGYGRCQADCRLGPACGDGVVDAIGGELCDDGVNDGSYETCDPQCQPAPFCGDGLPQAAFGEACDEGEDNVVSGYAPDLCTTRCRRAPFCGDAQVNAQEGEVCDDGVNDGSPGTCAVDCRSFVPLPSCGDGQIDAGEACDEGADNGAEGGVCDVRCQLACGNGFIDPTEDCDDGVNDGTYGTCNPDCSLAPFCGDGLLSDVEVCDLGDENLPLTEYAAGPGFCSTACFPAPFCGDGFVDSAFGETCDGGPACTSTCTILR